jgi:RNA polymerase sigma factor (TIGR02999 family)
MVLDSSNDLVPREVMDQVFLLTYEQLRSLARCVLRDHRSATLTPTVLVNEAWLKLSESPWLASLSPLHFRRIAGRAMRQVLVDAARRRNAARRGGVGLRITWDDVADPRSNGKSKDVLALDSALDELQKVSQRTAALVEAHFFGGLDWDECAELLGISKATVMRDWRYARAWLAKCLNQ